MLDNLRSKIKSAFAKKDTHVIQQAGKGISARSSYSSFNGFGGYGSGSKWAGGTNPGAPIDIHNHFEIRQKVRNQMYDSIEGRALLKSIADTSVDTGMRVKPTPIAEIIGRTPEELEQWAEDTAIKFHLWANDKKSHRSRVNNFYQNQHLYMWFKKRDNDMFTRLFYGRDKDLINPLQIDFTDPNQIRGFDYTSTYAQFINSDDGINRAESGREVSYRVWKLNADGSYKEVTVPAVGEKSGRYFMLHGYNPEYAGQGRGFSDMAHAIQELSDLTDFKHSVIQKAINQASFIGVIENKEQDASQPLEGRPSGPIEQYGSIPKPPADASNVTEESLEPVINWGLQNEATIRQPGSNLVGNLKRGDTWKNLQDTSPGAQYDKFVESFFASVCASTGWSIELVLKKFGENYSASRATLILCWRTASIERQDMIADFCDPIYETWLSEEIAAGRIQCPGWSDKRIRAAWLCCEWSSVPMPDIDPKKSIEAKKVAVELSAETLDDVAQGYNGSSGKANRMKNARQFEELPIPPWQPAGAAATTSDDDDEEDEEEE
ncbi:MAG: phage portal protein [Desulfobacteraceae bacterium]|jgi:lambda family phage portal protein